MESEDLVVRTLRAVSIGGFVGLAVASVLYFVVVTLPAELAARSGSATNPWYVVKPEFAGGVAFALASVALLLTPLPERRRPAAAFARAAAWTALGAYLFHVANVIATGDANMGSALASAYLAVGLVLVEWRHLRAAAERLLPVAAHAARPVVAAAGAATIAYAVTLVATSLVLDVPLMVRGHGREVALIMVGPVAGAWLLAAVACVAGARRRRPAT